MIRRSLTQPHRSVSLAAAFAFLVTALWLAAAGPTFACSCVQPQPMAAYATADNAVFTGTAGPSDARGVPVRIETWFSGPNPAAVVYLSAQSFGDSAGCGTNAPPAGTKWIWVAYVSPGNDPTTGLCSPHAQLGSPEGDKLLADAVATFQGAPPPGASDPPEPSNPQEAAPQSQPVAAELGIPIAIGTLALGLLVLTGAVVIARRRSRPTG